VMIAPYCYCMILLGHLVHIGSSVIFLVDQLMLLYFLIY
jgi:hypothetical protein